MNIIDLTGKTFGRWIVIKRVNKSNNGEAHWLCQCNCKDKNTKIVNSQSLRKGQSKSCGCLHKEIMTSHGLSHTKIYKVWKDMMYRCYNKKSKVFKNYGGRGIKVCKRWHNVKNFFEDVGRPPKGLTLERIDNNKGYSKRNCKWATYKEQNNNKRNNKH